MSKEKIKRIILHHSASEWGTVMDINQWHLERGWKGCGYHFTIQNGFPTYEDYKNNKRFYELVGEIECGRKLDTDPWLEANEVGAHAYGYNRDSIGICLIHKKEEYDDRMISKLFRFVVELIINFDIEVDNVVGHYELDENKPDCPSINMNDFRDKLKKHFKTIEKN